MPRPDSSRLRPVHALSLWAGYALVYWLVPQAYRSLYAQAAVGLVVVSGWLAGARAGVMMGLLGGVVNLAFYLSSVSSRSPLDSSASLLVGLSMLVVAGFAVGLLSDRVRAQLERRRESEERYALAANGANDGLWDWDLRSDRVFYSDRWRAILGYGPDEIAESPEDWLDRIHPEDIAKVRAQVQAHLQGDTPRYENEHRIRKHDGSWTWVLTRGIAIRDPDGKPRRMAGWLTDISARKDTEQRLRHYAFHDALTGLPNRALFMDRVQHALVRARRPPSKPFAVLMLDLDRFKNVNDSLGHLAGDELLIQVAERIQACVREGDTVARLGGDEFTVLLEDVDSEADAVNTGEHIQRALATPISLDGHDLVVSASIGVVMGHDGAHDALALLRQADQAMYDAKKQGKGRHVLFDPRTHESSGTRLTLETQLRGALLNQQLRVHFQPIVDLARSEVCGFEALVRWQHPALGLVSPADLIPIAEESGLIGELGEWMLEQALSALRELEQRFTPSAPFFMAVNLSAREIRREDLIERVERALKKASVSPSSLVLEVKESALMEDSSAGQDAFKELRKKGVRVHMDDFGTGYSSLSYLHRFELDALKIDGSFTGKLHESDGAEEIVRTVITIARDLGLRVVAEGVERPEQLARLEVLGCHEAQGFLFGAPLPLDELEALLRRGLRPHLELSSASV